MIDPKLERLQDALRVWCNSTPYSRVHLGAAVGWTMKADRDSPPTEEVEPRYTVELDFPVYDVLSTGEVRCSGREHCDFKSTLFQATGMAFARANEAWQREHGAAADLALHDDARNKGYEAVRQILAAQRVALDALCTELDAIFFAPPPSESR